MTNIQLARNTMYGIAGRLDAALQAYRELEGKYNNAIKEIEYLKNFISKPETPWCYQCEESPNCVVSMDGTCAMLRIYKKAKAAE